MSIVQGSTPTLEGPVSGDYAELLQEMRAHGLLKPRPAFYWLLGGAQFFALCAVVTGIVLLAHSWWAVALAPAYAVVSTQIAFFSHDAAHRQITHRPGRIAALCLIAGNLLNGLSYGWWIAKHNAHHAHPNDLDSDPDVGVGAFVFDADQAGDRTGFVGWLTRHQALLFFPMLTLEALNLRVSSVQAVLRPGIRRRGTEGALLLAHAVLYIGLLAATMSWAQALVFFAVHQALFGVYLGSSFAPSHKGMPTLTTHEEDDALLRQVLVSRNIRGGRGLDYAMGGLNLQIEHHLFPSMPRPNLRRAQPIVTAHCGRRGIGYAETSLAASYVMALRHLHDVGAPLRHRAAASQA